MGAVCTDPKISSSVTVTQMKDGSRAAQYDIDITFADIDVEDRQKFSYDVDLKNDFSVSQLSLLLTEVGAQFAELFDDYGISKLQTYTYLNTSQLDEIRSDPGIVAIDGGGKDWNDVSLLEVSPLIRVLVSLQVW